MQNSRNRLVELRKLLDNFSSGSESPEVQGELARFLVIRSAGYIENTFETCIQHFTAAHSHPFVASHVRAGLFRGRNPSPDVLIERTRSLNDNWAADLEEYLNEDDSRVRRELQYLVDRRNRIAHGQSESVNRRKALDLADLALALGDRFTDLFNPVPDSPERPRTSD
ncbi:HEPN domain-containing protein [Propionibacteriaceae bacterium Y1923]